MDAAIFYVLVGSVVVAALARNRGWPAPLLVTVVALAASFLPFVPEIEIDDGTVAGSDGRITAPRAQGLRCLLERGTGIARAAAGKTPAQALRDTLTHEGVILEDEETRFPFARPAG